jgi:peptide/nickel transport system permease protein
MLARALDSDLWWSFTRSPLTIIAATVAVIMIGAAVFAPWVAPHNPFDPRTLNIMNADTPPAWAEGGSAKFLLGTDNQGRDILSTILYGSRISLLVGISAILFAVVLGVGLGLYAGFRGGWLDAALMRIADIQLTIPGILIALAIDGVIRSLVPASAHDSTALYVLIFAIGTADWPQFARVARASALAEKNKDYVSAARVIGIPGFAIALKHVLPNVTGPVLVLATIGLALAVIAEASLSFLGVGMPPTQPSLGTLIRIGNGFLLSGEWWIALFPSLTLVILALAVNLLGDWLRDALNPKLR